MTAKDPIEAIDAFICENLAGDADPEKMEIAADLAKSYMAMSQRRYEQDRRIVGGALGDAETFEVVEELGGRTGVQVSKIAPTATATFEVSGPATVLEVID